MTSGTMTVDGRYHVQPNQWKRDNRRGLKIYRSKDLQ